MSKQFGCKSVDDNWDGLCLECSAGRNTSGIITDGSETL